MTGADRRNRAINRRHKEFSGCGAITRLSGRATCSGFGMGFSGSRQMESFSLDFVAVGPARTATTWLHNVLREHANLPVTTKETCFFDRYFGRGPQWYAAQFGERRDGQPSGEVAPTYFHSSIARNRIKLFAPNAKIVCTLRDPVERLYSLYRYKRSRAGFRWTFEQAVRHDEEMAESSRYVKHLTAWMDAFGQSRVMAILYDEIGREPQACIDRICEFVGVRPFTLGQAFSSPVNSSDALTAPRSYALARGMRIVGETFNTIGLNAPFRIAKWSGMKRLFIGNGAKLPPLDPAFAAELRDRFVPELTQLERLIGRDLSSWKAK